MHTISLKMPEPLAIRLEDAARKKGVSKSALIRDALEVYLQADRAESALSQVADLAGILSGPEDLSVNKDYLRNFGR